MVASSSGEAYGGGEGFTFCSTNSTSVEQLETHCSLNKAASVQTVECIFQNSTKNPTT